MDVEKGDHLLFVGIQSGAATMEINLEVSITKKKNLEIDLLYDLAMSL